MESSYFHLQLNENENPLVQSEVPWQGPFHVIDNHGIWWMDSSEM